LDVFSFRPVLERLSNLGQPVVVEGAILNLRLPHEAEQGLFLRVGGDRLNLYRFATIVAAEDYVALEGAWYCVPVGTKVERKIARRAGVFVLESDPDRQYADPAQVVRLPTAEINWSDLVTNERLIPLWSAGFSDVFDAREGSFVGLIRHLKESGYDVIEVSFLPHSQLRVGTTCAVAATINADRFAIYRCESEASGQRLVAELPHSIQIGRWVFRSIPIDMYEDQHYEIGQLAEEQIRWSALINNQRFLSALKVYLDGPPKSSQEC
jgi:hypothetical protein